LLLQPWASKSAEKARSQVRIGLIRPDLMLPEFATLGRLSIYLRKDPTTALDNDTRLSMSNQPRVLVCWVGIGRQLSLDFQAYEPGFIGFAN